MQKQTPASEQGLKDLGPGSSATGLPVILGESPPISGPQFPPGNAETPEFMLLYKVLPEHRLNAVFTRQKGSFAHLKCSRAMGRTLQNDALGVLSACLPHPKSNTPVFSFSESQASHLLTSCPGAKVPHNQTPLPARCTVSLCLASKPLTSALK